MDKVGDNAYKVDLPDEYSISATFNISDLSLFDVGDDSWTNQIQERGNNGNQDHEGGSKEAINQLDRSRN